MFLFQRRTHWKPAHYRESRHKIQYHVVINRYQIFFKELLIKWLDLTQILTQPKTNTNQSIHLEIQRPLINKRNQLYLTCYLFFLIYENFPTT